jgi:hypothetical protein
VKGRSTLKGKMKIWSFINVTRDEYENLKKNQKTRLLEVIIDRETKEVVRAYDFHFNDFRQERPLGVALYPRQREKNITYKV